MNLGFAISGMLFFLAGATVTWGIQRYLKASWLGELEKDMEEIQEELHQKELNLTEKGQALLFYRQELEESREALKAQTEEISLLRQKLVQSQVEQQSSQKRLKEQRKEFAFLHETSQKNFSLLANAIFEEKSALFQRMSQEGITALLEPLKEKIQDFRNRVEAVHTTDMHQRGELREQIRTLGELNQRISQDARNLTEALKGDTKVMGNWGEMILERVLEEAGLEKGREYKLQPSLMDSQGQRLRPDGIIYLPKGRHLVVDAKVSLVAYEGFCNAQTTQEKEKYLKEHLASLERHVASLGSKNYNSLDDVESPDFVFMFVPLEPALLLAQKEDPPFMNKAFHRGVFPVSPGTLLFALRTVANIWLREKQNRHVLEIARHSGDLYDKFVLFCEELEHMGMHLEKAQDAYHHCRNRLVQGRGNLVHRTEILRELGAKAKKEIPPKLLQEAREDNLPTEEPLL